MMGRRTAAMLCVLLGHALVVFALLNLTQPKDRLGPAGPEPAFVSQLFFIEEDEHAESESPEPEVAPRTQPAAAAATPSPPASATPPAGESAAITPPGYVDWPVEGKQAVARVLAEEAEAERIARMFAGPGGTWAALTKRQRSELNKFRWKRGVEGLKYDDKGNSIYELPNGCTVVNLMFFGCPIGFKPKVHGDMFDNMREYFDEQRLPETKEGNGTEPEAMRPPR